MKKGSALRNSVSGNQCPSRRASPRKWSEDILLERGLQLKAIVEAFDGLIYLVSEDYRIEFLNAHYVRRIGYDATGELCYKALHNRDSVCPWCLNQRVLTGETVRCEVLTPRNNWYYVVSTPIRHANGSVSKLAMIIDISDRKQAEEALRQKVDERELLLDNIQIQIWYLSDVATYGAVNKARAEFLGLSKEALERKTLYEIHAEAESQIYLDANQKVFKSRVEVRTEEWAVNGSGEKRLLSITRTPKLDQNGAVEYVVCSGIDITDFRNTEESLRRSKERLDLALEATKDALWDLDILTEKAYFSPCFYSMLGYDPHELPANLDTWKSLIHPEDNAAAINAFKACVTKKVSAFTLEYRLKTRQGDWRWVMARGKVVDRDDGGTPVRMIGTHVDITDRKQNEEELRKREAQLREENIRLKSSFKDSNRFGDIIGRSQRMHRIYDIILKAASSNANVIIYGESGTGKELVAKTIHELSNRHNGNFVTVHCGAIPGNLIESEFFGYKKGAFTGADMDKPGYLDRANGGTLFMDEIGEIDLIMQVKLLRVIEGGGYTPIGSSESRKPDVRLIAATNRDLKHCVEKGFVREDFYYRIHIIPIHLPPLRERKEDIPLLIRHFLESHADGGETPFIPDDIMRALLTYDWPGNVRELENTIHRYITLREIDLKGVSKTAVTSPDSDPRMPSGSLEENCDLRTVMEDFERQYIQKMLQEHHWHRSKVAALLGINRRTLFRKMKALGID